MEKEFEQLKSWWKTIDSIILRYEYISNMFWNCRQQVSCELTYISIISL